MQNQPVKAFMSLIFSLKLPKLVLILGLIGSVLTTLVGLTIPLLTRELVDGFSIASISIGFIALIVGVFVMHALIDGFSAYALSYVGQKVVAGLREVIWSKLIRLPVRYFDQQPSGESVSRVINDTGIVKNLVAQHFPQFISGIISIFSCYFINYGLAYDTDDVSCGAINGVSDDTTRFTYVKGFEKFAGSDSCIPRGNPANSQ